MATVWHTVRVFVSSTFRDMHAERDHLAKMVFPELRERMAEHSLQLVDLDLRWGVTEAEAEQGKVLEVCLEEIDRCRPFFIGILGQRYGWVPDEIPEEAELDNPWLSEYRQHSITALEIIHGVLRNPAMANRSYFYFRDPAYIEDIPAAVRENFVAESPKAEEKLAGLKAEIGAAGVVVREDYPCRWDAEQGQVVGLDEFGNQVLEDLWEAICEEYPEEAPEEDPLAVEREMHEALVARLSRIHIGREEEKRRLTEYVEGEERRPIVITGESGCGKSAFLATWYREYAPSHPDDFVFAHFIGASPDSTNHFRLLRRACEELKREFDLVQELPEDDKDLPDTLTMLLVAATRGPGLVDSVWRGITGRKRRAKQRRVVLITDALNQLDEQEAAHGLGWLPLSMPENVRLVVSSLEGDCLEVLRRREAAEIVIPPLAGEDREEIVRTVLGQYRKKLDERQMRALLAHEATDNPLYLRVALEELRLFGVFEDLTARIESLAEDVPGLFEQVLARVESDHRQFPVASALALLAGSRHGLAERELLEMLEEEVQAEIPRLLWARLRRSLAAYLVQRGELFDFFHRHLWKAAQDRYRDHQSRHRQLAEHFVTAPLARRLDEWPYQLAGAEMWEGLAGALTDLDFFDYAWEGDREYEWMGYWRSLEGRFAPGASYAGAVADKEKSEGETQAVARLSHIIGGFLLNMGMYVSGVPFAKRAVDIWEGLLGPEHPDLAAGLNNLALLYNNQGRYEEALPLYKRALEIDEKVLGPDHPNVARDLNNLALLYNNQGRYEEALPLYERALATKEKALGADHPSVATSLSNLAELYRAQGKYEEALPLYERALAIGERALGPDHPHVATALNNLAELYRDQGRYEQALPLYERALEINEKALGLDHPDVAIGLNNLALLYNTQGRYEEALPLYERSLEILEKALGADHPSVATSLSNLAELYCDQARYEEALPLYQRALAIWESALGPDHPNVARGLNNLAELYCDQARYEEALPLLRRALAIWESALGPDHPNVARGLNNLAELYMAQGEYEEAQPLLRRALAIDEKALGPDHRSVAGSLSNLAALYYDRGEYEEAQPLYQRALEIREKALGPDHPDTAHSLNNLAALHYAQGRCEEALPLYQRALAIVKRALGVEHPHTKRFRDYLRRCQQKMRGGG